MDSSKTDSSKSNNRSKQTSPLRIVSPVHRANREFSLHFGARLERFDVPPTDCHILSYIHVYGPCPIGEVVRVFGHKKTTMTSTLDRLEVGGYVERVPNPEDRRSVLVNTTPAGAKVATAARDEVEGFEREIMSRITDDDFRGFENVFRAITEFTGVSVRPRTRDGGEE